MKNYYIVALEDVNDPEVINPKHTSLAEAKKERKSLANVGKPTFWKIFKVTTTIEEIK